MKNFLQNQFPQVPFWSDDRWKACLAAGEGVKRRHQYCTDISGTIVHLRALQGHSGRNLIDPTLQDNVIKQSGFLQDIHHIRCAFNLHSIIHNGIDTWRPEFKQETDSMSSCPLIPETKNIKILNTLIALYHVEHNTCTVLGSNIKTRYFG